MPRCCSDVLRSAFCVSVGIAVAAAGARPRRATRPLVDAVKRQDKTVTRTLLKQKADVNAADAEGMTALHWAAHWDDLDTVKLLVSAGAKAKVANRYGVTPLHEACTVGNVADDRSAARCRRRSERRARRRRNAADDRRAHGQHGRRAAARSCAAPTSTPPRRSAARRR